jgi:hypothetical protein
LLVRSIYADALILTRVISAYQPISVCIAETLAGVYIEAMEHIDPVAELRRACDAAASQRQWALAHGVSAQYVADVLAGRRDPGPAILAALGLAKETVYRRLASQ